MEPLTYKARKDTGYPGGRDVYADPALKLGISDWKKYEYYYRLWGRLLFNPDTDPEVWRRYLRHEFAEAAEASEQALGFASRILPSVTVSHLPSAAHTVNWTEHAAIDHSQLAYQEALEALKYQIQFGKRAVLYLQDLQPSEQNVVRYPIQQLQILSQAIKSGDTAKAQETVKEIIHELPRDNVMLQEYQFALLRIIIDILKIPADLGISIHYLVNKDNLYIDMLLKKNRGQLIAWINHECIVPVIEAIHLNRNAQRLRIIEEVQRIIHLEFDQNLTLESVAARLDIHPSYIRRLIKQETGSSFNQFLSDYRLEIAKQWLANTDMKIMEIADSLCYNNPQNFIRYFRRMTGITPGQYREVSSKLPEDFNPDLDRPEEN
ncbi:helix-turn-helix transcriptional regulator [Paenibacillus sp. TAB 01]|uniref:helix-turn-helix transcriptional regulator n=1 Tax=Paenibacillus sp. TAB 01 TaxID=3368988 RepID=UPI0037503E26